MQDVRRLLDIAQGRRQADLVLKGADIVNVFSDEIMQADIAITDGLIIGVGSYEGVVEIPMQGKYICPGFIDAHLHFESTLVTPAEVVHNASLWGTTTFIVDPHESANVSGLAGIDYIIKQTEAVPANVYLMMPSCVPATPFEDNGYSLSAEDMKPYVEHPRILGLGEVMDYQAVLAADPGMLQKIALFRHKIIDGHAPGLSEQQLSAYALAGIATDHEAVDFAYALLQRRQGIHVLIREGSAARNVTDIVQGIIATGIDTAGFSFCTDDKHIADIRQEGHISYNIKKAIGLGLNPITAIKLATINTARVYGLKHLGAIAPGYQADLVILNDLYAMDIAAVYYKGELLKPGIPLTVLPCPASLRNTINISPDFAPKLQVELRENPTAIIQVVPGQIITQRVMALLPVEDAIAQASSEFNKVAVIERHQASNKVGVAFVAGFGIRGGAIASSVAHDSHNVIVIGDNDSDIVLAVKEIIRMQGGLSIAAGGQVKHCLPLPIMGLMSDAGFSTVNETLRTMKAQARLMGVAEGIDPFLTLSFLSLPVIPEIRITTRGLYDVVNSVISKP